MNKQMLSFHNDPAIKEKYLERLRMHHAADEIIQGTGWENGKGCAVGCTLHNYSHAAYETELGIPRILARLEDRIFEGLTLAEAKDFPINFLSAIPVGVDLKDVYKKLFVWMLTDPTDGVIKYAKRDETKKAIQDVSDLLQKSLIENVTSEQFIEVGRAAAAAAAADAAADADAYAAAAAAAADAYAAADADADAAADADAYAAAAAAAADAYAAADADAYAAAAAAAADAAARHEYYTKLAAKLIELLKAA